MAPPGEYSLRVLCTAQRCLDRLPEVVAAAVVEFMLGPLTKNPQRVGKRLRRQIAHLHSARRGPYRVIYRIDEEERVVEVQRIDHRNDAYRMRG